MKYNKRWEDLFLESIFINKKANKQDHEKKKKNILSSKITKNRIVFDCQLEILCNIKLIIIKNLSKTDFILPSKAQRKRNSSCHG